MMTKDKKEMIISWLEINRNNGFFEGESEEDINGKYISDYTVTIEEVKRINFDSLKALV